MEYKVWTTCPIIGLMLLLLLVNSLAAAQTQSTERIDAGPTTSPGPPTPTIPKLPLAIHYEALCPDSKNFVRLRLYDALADNDWWPRTELKLYPFGKANFYNNTETGELEVFCQHDERECELNALHACIIEHMELRKAFELINCMLRSYSNQIDSCARHLSYDVTAAKECKQTRKTAEILLPYGKETLALGLSFVPTIVFDNKFEPYEQSSIRYNFESHFCRHYNEKFHIKLPTCN